MNILSACLVLLPLVVLTSAHPLFCNCGLGPGENICNKCTPLVVRPLEVPKPVAAGPRVVCTTVGGIPPLVPIGSPCSCHTSFVKPAVVPKPACTVCSGRLDLANEHHLTLSQREQVLFGGANIVNNDVILTTADARPILVDEVAVNPANPANFIPADPVSLSVAYKRAQESCDINEDKLSFGFRAIPKDIPLYAKKIVNIPEEDLFSLNGQIVELKKLKCNKIKTLDEEAAEELLAIEEAEEDQAAFGADQFKRISLGELGYGPAKIKPATFVNVESTGPGALVEELLVDQNARFCNDGFQPGNVVIKQVPKPNHLSLPPLLPPPCVDVEDEIVEPSEVYPPSYGSPYTFLSSQSSSSLSSANQYSRSTLLHKLGCN